MKYIINIGGKAEHGKDTFATILKQKLEEKNNNYVLILHFADHLKYICKQYFGWDGNKDAVGREKLQHIGTNIVRERSPDFWVTGIRNFIEVFKFDFDYFLLPDFRFPNEYRNLIYHGLPVITVKINRYNFENSLTIEQRNHPSETALNNFEFDYVVNVDEGLDKVKIEVDKFIDYYSL